VVNDLGGKTDGSGSSEAAANRVVEEIKAAGGEAVPNFDNVATIEGGEHIVQTAIDAFGKLDILINNAGILRDQTFAKMGPENWDAVLNVHLRGSYCVTRPAFTHMREKGYGRIVMTSSGSGLFGNFGQSNYGAAKTALLGLTNVLKLEGARYNINVNVIVPSALTRMTEGLLPPELAQAFLSDYITPATLYLCSEQCRDTGAYINAFAGYYSRSAIVTGPGIKFSKVPSVEELSEKWTDITSLENAMYYDDINKMMEIALKTNG
jgi:NAD(P)-dependent dehydrogenase (short-subunit alcohol dehydrogenase family)